MMPTTALANVRATARTKRLITPWAFFSRGVSAGGSVVRGAAVSELPFVIAEQSVLFTAAHATHAQSRC